MIVMAIVTTAMAGPLLHFIYPERFVRRDIEEADRIALGTEGPGPVGPGSGQERAH